MAISIAMLNYQRLKLPFFLVAPFINYAYQFQRFPGRTSPETMSTGGMPSFPPRRPWESSSELGCPVPTEAGIVLLEDCFRAYLSLKQKNKKNTC